MKLPSAVWLAWFLAGMTWVMWFAVAEGIALVNRVKGDTLSEVVWRLHLPAAIFFLGGGLLLGLLTWLVIHFVSQGKWGL